MSTTWLTTKLVGLRPRIGGTGAKELVSNSDKSSTSSSSSGKKRKENETEHDNMKQTPNKKKPRHEVEKHLTSNVFLYQKILTLSLV